MILLREIQERDISALEQFAQIPGFINLPNDRDLLLQMIRRSHSSFSDTIENKSEAKYIFAAEDIESGHVIGTSMIAAQHGTPESPHFYFEIGTEEKFSHTINTGFIHGTLKLKFDSNGPSEIGGLVLSPDYRNSDAKLGRQIAFVRFLFLGLNRSRFKKKVLAELLPPLNKKGQSPLWEAVGRRFTNMDYWEADQLCQRNKEFIFSLFPSGKVYTTFLPAEARNAVGKVGKQTEPVYHMLTKLGFKYKNQVDPFDGGPHLWANVDELLPLKRMKQGSLQAWNQDVSSPVFDAGLLTPAQAEKGKFRAVAVQAAIQEERGAVRILLQDESKVSAVCSALGITAGSPVHFMPYY
jgi:arginine N-succinyltransferase